MNITEEKNRLKNEIDKVDNPDVLLQISHLLAASGNSLLTDEQMAIVMESREEYIKNPSSAMSLEDFEIGIRKKHGF